MVDAIKQLRQCLFMTKLTTTVKVKDLKRWLELGGDIKVLASHMGYENYRAVEKWIYRRKIPTWQQKRLKEFLNGVKNQ